MSTSPTDVVHDLDQNRFTITLPNSDQPAVLRYNVLTVAGKTVYDMYSTRVPESMRGQGIAGHLVKGALAIVREKGYKIMPTCSYIPVHLKRHPEDTDVVMK